MKLKAFLLGLVLVGAAPQVQAKEVSDRVVAGVLSLVAGAILSTDTDRTSTIMARLALLGGLSLIVNKVADDKWQASKEPDNLSAGVCFVSAGLAMATYASLLLLMGMEIDEAIYGK